MSSRRGFGEALSGEHGVQHGAVIRRLARRDDHKDIGIIGEPAEEDVKLGCFGMHDEEPGRSGGGVCISSSAVLERFHDIR